MLTEYVARVPSPTLARAREKNVRLNKETEKSEVYKLNSWPTYPGCYSSKQWMHHLTIPTLYPQSIAAPQTRS